jgi:hypothetical protein
MEFLSKTKSRVTVFETGSVPVRMQDFGRRSLVWAIPRDPQWSIDSGWVNRESLAGLALGGQHILGFPPERDGGGGPSGEDGGRS